MNIDVSKNSAICDLAIKTMKSQGRNSIKKIRIPTYEDLRLPCI